MDEYVGKICPYCKTEIKEGEEVKVCPECGIPHHAACWEENKGCTTFGCKEQHYEEQHTNPTDVCTNCGAPLGDGQAFCPKCGTPKNAPKKNVCGSNIRKCDNLSPTLQSLEYRVVLFPSTISHRSLTHSLLHEHKERCRSSFGMTVYPRPEVFKVYFLRVLQSLVEIIVNALLNRFYSCHEFKTILPPHNHILFPLVSEKFYACSEKLSLSLIIDFNDYRCLLRLCRDVLSVKNDPCLWNFHNLLLVKLLPRYTKCNL